MEFQIFTVVIQVFVALMSVYYFFKKDKSPFVFALTLLLALTAIVEISGAVLIYVFRKNTLYLHYFNILIMYTLIFRMYTLIISNKRKKNIMQIMHIVFIILWGVFLFEKQIGYTIIIGSFNTSIYLFFYLNQLLTSEEIINYKKILPFWVTVSFFTFYLPSVPFFIIVSYLKDRPLFVILNILTLVMNLILMYGFICSNKEEKY